MLREFDDGAPTCTRAKRAGRVQTARRQCQFWNFATEVIMVKDAHIYALCLGKCTWARRQGMHLVILLHPCCTHALLNFTSSATFGKVLLELHGGLIFSNFFETDAGRPNSATAPFCFLLSIVKFEIHILKLTLCSWIDTSRGTLVLSMVYVTGK